MPENHAVSEPLAPITREQRFLAMVVQTADALKRHYAAVLEPHGLTLPQLNVLRILRRAGGEGLPTLTIRDRMVERAPGITRLLDRLVAAGWIERERNPADRRVVHCRLTEEGHRLLETLDPVVDAANAVALGGLDEADRSVVIRVLGEVLEAIDPDAELAG